MMTIEFRAFDSRRHRVGVFMMACAFVAFVAPAAQGQAVQYAFTTLAGKLGGPGSDDGTGSAARFNGPQGVTVDSAGNVYVADSDNNTIRKVTPTGLVTTLAGTVGQSGSTDGTGSAARFNFPRGIAVDSAGSLYVADTRNNTIRKVTPTGIVTTLAGSAGQSGSDDGAGSAARFNDPRGVAVDSAGTVFIADGFTIRRVTPDGVVATLAGSPEQCGSADGIGSAARFGSCDDEGGFRPGGLAVDSMGNVYVADTGNNTIRKVTPDSVVTTVAGSPRQSGSDDGTGSAARFSYPHGVSVDSAGNVFVADSDNSTIRKVSPDAVVTTLAGSAGQGGSDDGTGSPPMNNRGPSELKILLADSVDSADTRCKSLEPQGLRF